MYLKEGTYHTRLFGGSSTNGMKKWDGPSLSWPTPHTTPLFLPRRTLTCPTPPKLDPRMKRRTTPPKPYLPPQTRTRHRLSHRPHRQCRCGVIPLPQRVLHPTNHVQQDTHPTDKLSAQLPRKNGAGEARRRDGRRRGRPPSADRHRPRGTRHHPAPQQTPPSNTTHPTSHIFTNDPHYRKPAHSLRRSPTGGHPRRAATVCGRPPGDTRRQPRVRPTSGRPPVET